MSMSESSMARERMTLKCLKQASYSEFAEHGTWHFLFSCQMQFGILSYNAAVSLLNQFSIS